MPENNVPNVACFICIGVSPPHFKYVVSHEAYASDPQVSTTPATAIPNDRLAEVRTAGKDVLKAIREKCSDYNDKVHPYNDDHHIEVTLTIGEIKRFHAALTLLGDTP